MSTLFSKAVKKFALVAFLFENNSTEQKQNLLAQIAKMKLPNNIDFITYHNLLMFTFTHAQNDALAILANKEMHRLAAHLKKGNNAQQTIFADTGLPFTPMNTRFTQDAFNTLVKNNQVYITLDALQNEAFDLNAFLTISLPKILKEETTAGLENDEILALLGVPKDKKFEFLLQEINNINASPLCKDYLWQSLQSFFIVQGKVAAYSKTFNRLKNTTFVYTNELIKKFDHLALLEKSISAPVKLSKQAKEDLILVIQNSMPLSMREIDPVTYMDENSIKYFELEHGMSMAIYGMIPKRQLPMQSFVSYTLFKNGYPISYGGAWVFGHGALFALNIFEEYRGGESKYIMTQILRVYKQVFDLYYYEVEPYQFGNADALQTGAFWFYYKFGFRPLEKEINKLALAEAKKIEKNKSYKSNIKTLEALAQGNIAMHINNKPFTHRNKIMQAILHLIASKYKGQHLLAIADAKKYFRLVANFSKKLNAIDEIVFEEIALWAFAFQIKDKQKLNAMTKMIAAKSTDYLQYNRLIQQII